jgi:hypothetical protein
MKRIAATALWFYAGWFAGAFVAFVAGLSPVVGPVVAIAAAAVVATDPRGLIWGRSASGRRLLNTAPRAQNPA